MTHKLTCAAALGLALGMLVSAPIAAQESAAPCRLVDYDPILRPDPEDTPTEVGIGIYVVSVDRVDTADQSFRLDAFVRSSWMDPRLAAAVNAGGVQGCRFPLSEVWEPRVFVFNQQSASSLLPEVVSVDTEGRVRYLQRIQATLHAPMELEDFPLDRQLLPLTLISIEYGPESLSLHHDETAARRVEDMTLPAWHIESVDRRSGVLEVQAGVDSSGGRRFARYDFAFQVRRELSFFIWRVIGPLTFIVLMSWAVFWIDPSNFAVQIGLASTSILTLVAFLFSLGNALPRLGYLTRMDIFLFSSLALAFLAFAEAVTTAVLKAKGHEDRALRIDRWARWLFPIAFAALHLVLWTT